MLLGTSHICTWVPFAFVPCVCPSPSPARELQWGLGHFAGDRDALGMGSPAWGVTGVWHEHAGPRPGDPADGTAASCRRAGDTAAAHGDIPWGPGHTQATWLWGSRLKQGVSFPFPNPGCHILPRLLLFGGRKGRGRGLAVISNLSPGQGHRNATR